MELFFNSMKIRTKIILSLAITAILIIASYLIFLGIKLKRDHLLWQSYQDAQLSSVSTALRINEKNMINLVTDYANWDDMVGYTQSASQVWSKSNLSTVLTIHSLSGLWIFNTKRQLVFSQTETGADPNISLLFTDSLFHFLERKRSAYFFNRQGDSFFEFAAAPIRPTADTLQFSPSFGFFIICRNLDKSAMRSLEEISGSTVRMTDSPYMEQWTADESQIITHIQLHAWNSSPVGIIEFRRDQPLLRSYLAITNITSLFYLGFALTILIIVSIALYHWLDFPLKKIAKSLALEDSDLIKPIARQKNEFGQVAMMIERFFEQKKELADIIHDKNEALSSLADAESKNRAILSAIPDHLFRINLFGIISDCQIKNPGDFFISPDKMTGSNFEEIMPPGFSFHLHRAISEVNKIKQPQLFHFSVPGPKDKIKYFEATISHTNLGDYLVVVRNITTRKEAELALYRMLEKEGELNRMKTHFLTTVSHEFRTPLSAILSNIQMLELYDEKWQSEKKIPAFSRIQHAVKQMITLLNDLSVVARDEAGKFQLNPIRFDLALFLDELVKDTTNTINPALNLKVEFTLKDEMVTMDRELFRYIFTNLISNAIKFSPGNEEIIIQIIEEQNNKMVLRIRDHGIGIPPGDLPAIFEPFHRGQNVTGYPGTGLGLSIVKRCVDLHRGSISIESLFGDGTVITVVLPRLLT